MGTLKDFYLGRNLPRRNEKGGNLKGIIVKKEKVIIV